MMEPAQIKIFLCAYACEPGKGSEPGVGWHTACALAKRNAAWVLTRSNNKAAINQALLQLPQQHRPQFIYHDLPDWIGRWKYTSIGLQVYYYLWQWTAIRVARRAHASIGFEIAHHLTFGRIHSPSCAAFLNIPFILGPVGGGDYVPPGFEKELGWSGRLREATRRLIHACASFDPLVRFTIRKAAVALGTTPAAVARLKKLGASGVVERCSESALTQEDLDKLQRMANTAPETPVRFISIGRLLGLKGYTLGLQAFARANIPDAEYWIVGDGPYRARLQSLARRLGIADRIQFLGWCDRDTTLAHLGAAHVLVHPSLHDSGGWVCLEAMAAGKPVICLDWAGPSTQVTPDSGIRVTPQSIEQVVDACADAMARLARDPEERRRMGSAGQARVVASFTWTKRIKTYESVYAAICRIKQKSCAF
jgi:glycosyltransferase involved in cell wall biosynthesis